MGWCGDATAGIGMPGLRAGRARPGKTPEEAYILIENALTGATTVAQMRQVLIQLLPIIGAGLGYLARSLEE